jgi:hypothetical protein
LKRVSVDFLWSKACYALEIKRSSGYEPRTKLVGAQRKKKKQQRERRQEERLQVHVCFINVFICSSSEQDQNMTTANTTERYLCFSRISVSNFARKLIFYHDFSKLHFNSIISCRHLHRHSRRFLYIFLTTYACYMLCLSVLIWVYLADNIRWRAQFENFPTMQLASCYLFENQSLAKEINFHSYPEQWMRTR